MIRIHDTLTDEIIDREMTEEELAIHENEQSLFLKQKIKVEESEAKKKSLETKLIALGLTENDLKILGL